MNIRQSLVMLLAVGAAVTSAACGHDSGSRAAADSSGTHATASAAASGEPVGPEPVGPTASASEAARIAPPPAATLVKALGAAEQHATNSLPADNGRDLVLGNCLICHGASMIEQQHKDSTGWDKTVSQMIGWGAPVQSSQKPALIAYLAQHFPARAAGPPARPVP